MKNNRKMILRESTKTSEILDNILTLKYTLTADSNYGESVIPRNEEHGDRTCQMHSGVKCNEDPMHSIGKEEVSYSGDLPIYYSLTVASFIDGIADDERHFEDISRNKDEAERIFDIMNDNSVTPETAEYILEELLSFGFAETQKSELSVG